jgi:hypothetical protein
MKGKWLLLVLPLLGVFSCAGDPEPAEPEAPPPVVEVYQEPVAAPVPEEETFDPTTITQEVFEDTKSEIQRLVENLNRIISAKDYDSWLSYLGESRREEIHSPEYLQMTSETRALKSQGLVLKTAQDYFIYVVVPSRANARADDIEFVSQNRVKAYTVNQNGTSRLRLFDLEKNQGSWKIIN